MSFSEQAPSKQWAALKYRGEKFAEVWFKPEGEPCAVIFRILQKSFHIPGRPYLWISFSRSGDTSEAVAAIQASLEGLPDVRHLIISCNKNGRLLRDFASLYPNIESTNFLRQRYPAAPNDNVILTHS